MAFYINIVLKRDLWLAAIFFFTLAQEIVRHGENDTLYIIDILTFPAFRLIQAGLSQFVAPGAFCCQQY